MSKTLFPVELETERLVLREFRKDDWKVVHEYAVDPEVVRYMPWGPNDERDTKDFIARALASQLEDPRTKFEFAITVAATDRLIGGTGIRISRPESLGADMGYCLRRDVWSDGYATEAARAVVAFGFERLGLHRIFATCDIENAASARVLGKAGMRREAHFREDEWVRGQWRSSYLYAILVQEWKELSGR